MDNAGVPVDAVDGAVGTSARAVAPGERPEQGLSDTLRVYREHCFTEFEHRSGNRFREPLGNRPTRGRVEAQLIVRGRLVTPR